MANLGSFEGKSRTEIQKALNEQGFKAHKNGNSKIYTKDLGNGETLAVRLDPADRKLAMNPEKSDWAGAKTHAHKEVVPTADVQDKSYLNKGYDQKKATKLDDAGNPSSDPSKIHMPINTRKGR